MDAYRLGLNGTEAVWAAKKYRSHRCLPPGAVKEVRKAVVKRKEQTMASEGPVTSPV